jgi:hypothetical protein
MTADVTLRFVLSNKTVRTATWRLFGDDAAGDEGADLLARTHELSSRPLSNARRTCAGNGKRNWERNVASCHRARDGEWASHIMLVSEQLDDF